MIVCCLAKAYCCRQLFSSEFNGWLMLSSMILFLSSQRMSSLRSWKSLKICWSVSWRSYKSQSRVYWLVIRTSWVLMRNRLFISSTITGNLRPHSSINVLSLSLSINVLLRNFSIWQDCRTYKIASVCSFTMYTYAVICSFWGDF